jgi:uncharacterized protein YcbX
MRQYNVINEDGEEVSNEFLDAIARFSTDINDFVRKVNYGITNHMVSISEDNDREIRAYWNDHFVDTGLGI